MHRLPFVCCSFFVSIYFLIRRGYLQRLIPNKETVKSALAFGIPLIPHSASAWIRQGLDRYVINYFYMATQVGIYSFAYNFANIIQIIGLAFNATNSYIYIRTCQYRGRYIQPLIETKLKS